MAAPATTNRGVPSAAPRADQLLENLASLEKPGDESGTAAGFMIRRENGEVGEGRPVQGLLRPCR